MSNSEQLTEQEITTIEDFLTSDRVPEGCLDYIACHGFLTATSLITDTVNISDYLSYITDGDIQYDNDQQQTLISALLSQLQHHIHRQLYLGEDVDFPMVLELPRNNESNLLTDWCFGFMEAIGADEAHWFGSGHDESAIAELIIPITIFSEPHVDPELLHLVKDEDQREQLLELIPDNLQQLYLLFRD